MKNENLLRAIVGSILFGLLGLLGWVIYITCLPSVNFHDGGFITLIVIMIIGSIGIISLFDSESEAHHYELIALGIIVVATILSIVPGSRILNADKYANRISPAEAVFEETVDEWQPNVAQVYDKAGAMKLGDRVMGQNADYVSEYVVSNLYSAAVVNGRLVRLTPLEHNGFVKYLNNAESGTPGYIMVDVVTGAVELVKVDGGLKFVQSAYFNKDLARHIQTSHPSKIIGGTYFEVDDGLNPYWVSVTYDVKYVGKLKEADGVIITNPVNGETIWYPVNDVPNWVDHVYDASLIMEQYRDYGKYQNGWLNSWLGQKGVTQVTDDYAYLAKNGDLYVYTGVTSVANDESNIGFIYANLRTKETLFFAIPGAEEYSAKASAEGAVQEKGHESTFPTLINLEGAPTYFMSMKDAAGLVKAYAFVDVADYQKVVVTEVNEGLEKAAQNFLNLKGVNVFADQTALTKEIVIESIHDVVVDGNTYYYFQDTEGFRYKASISVSDSLPFMQAGDAVLVEFYEAKEALNLVEKIR